MFVRDERGQTSAELVGILLVIGVIFAGLASSGVAAATASAMKGAICSVTGGECSGPSAGEPPGGAQPQPGEPQPQPAPGAPSEFPGFDAPFRVLPFPGHVSVTCSYSPTSTGPCQGTGPGVGVQTTSELSIERSETQVDAEGCPTQTLSVTTSLELAATGSAENPRAGGSLEVFTGSASTYAITVPPGAAEALERGERPAPNPIDPRTIGPGESVELSEEFYAGHDLEASYRALQVSMGFEEGRETSAGVSRVDPDTVRITAGDAEFVRNALSVGVGNENASVALASSKELSEGKLRSVDIDISTPAGWAAYQAFLTSGELPADGAPGTRDPTTSEVLDVSESTAAEANLGNLTLGGTLNESGLQILETTNADGSIDIVSGGFYNDVGVWANLHLDPGEEDGEPQSYSLVLESVDPSWVESFEHVSGHPLPVGPDGTVRFDFTPGDLSAMQSQAIEHLVQRTEEERRPMTREEVEAYIEENGLANDYGGLNNSFDPDYEIAAAESPRDVMLELYGTGGPYWSSEVTMAALQNFMERTAIARGYDAAAVLPGTPAEPSCG